MRLLFRVDDDIVDTDGMMQRVNEMESFVLSNAFENETAMNYDRATTKLSQTMNSTLTVTI